MDNSAFIFELLLRDIIFMEEIDEYIGLLGLTTGKIKPENIPQFVLSIVTLLQDKFLYTKILRINKTHKFTKDDMYKLLELYCQYIISKIICDFDKKQFITIYNTCSELACMRLQYKPNTSLGCI